MNTPEDQSKLHKVIGITHMSLFERDGTVTKTHLYKLEGGMEVEVPPLEGIYFLEAREGQVKRVEKKRP